MKIEIYSILLSILVIFGVLPMSFASSENVAIIVSTPADAVVAAPYAKAMGYMLIYTPTNELSDQAKIELERNNINKVIIVGGPVAVSNTVENQIKKLNINVERVWGETRVETSLKMFELIKKEKPEMAKNIVVAEGFNEKIIPVAVSFGAPVIYYGLNKDNEVADILKTTTPENVIILGNKIPKIIINTVSTHAKYTIIASGSDDSVIKTALAYVPKINPNVKNKDVAVVYGEKSKNIIIDAIVDYVKGYVSAVVPIPVSKEDVINKIVSKLTFASEILVLSDSTSISNMIYNIANKVGIPSTLMVSSISSGGGGSGGGAIVTQPVTQPVEEKPAIKIIANGKTIEFEGQDKNTLSIKGTKTINLTTIEAEVNVVNKKDTEKGVEIYFKDNDSVASIIESMNNFNAVVYKGENITITYNNADMNGKEVTLSVINDRQKLREAINNMLNGNASEFIELIKNNQYTTKTVSDGKTTWTLPTDNYTGVVTVIVTEGVPNDTYVKILGVGGFLVAKYNMTLTYNGTNKITNDITYKISINETPVHKIRYGLVMINKDATVKVCVDGTNPNNDLFNVSVVGDNNKETIVDNNHIISLNASKINDIIGTIFNPETASATYSDITTNSTVTLTLQNVSNAYVIGIAYDTEDKKIVAIEEIK
ncbi:cell wall-binding repeat-containing protein [Methanocaldococcus sp. 28A]